MYQPNDVMLKMPPLKASFSGIVLPLVAMVAVTNNVIVPRYMFPSIVSQLLRLVFVNIKRSVEQQIRLDYVW